MSDARSLTPLSEVDYEAISAAVMETGRGRWFLAEYAKRNRNADTAMVLDAAQSPERDVPEYLEVDHRAMKGRFGRAPKLSDVPYPVQMEPHLVVEFYSR